MSNPRPASARLVVGDCVDAMQDVAIGSCALVLADPPYEGVVSANWDQVKDYMAFSRAWLAEAVRALRPGGALLSENGEPGDDSMFREGLIAVFGPPSLTRAAAGRLLKYGAGI